jgi:ABC-type multidrug transport system fused ATPase/permease subunit
VENTVPCFINDPAKTHRKNKPTMSAIHSKGPWPDAGNDPGKRNYGSLFRKVPELLSPYRRWLLIIFLSIAVETFMGLASPWPLKIIIDHVIGVRPLPHWILQLGIHSKGPHDMGLAAWAALAMIGITAMEGLAGYINNYFTESVAQHTANDLRRKLYHHLEHLSLDFYARNQVGKILSTITTDVSTIQDFASSTLISILVDTLTIAGMLALMFWLNWDFALIAVAVSPFLLMFIFRFRRAVKSATREVRKDQGEMVTLMQHGLESIRSVSAFGRQDLEEDKLDKISRQAMDAALKARRVKSLISPVVTFTVSACMALVLWRGASLVLADAMTIGALTVFLAYLVKFFNPVKDLAKMTGTIAQASVAWERIQQIFSTQPSITDRPDAIDPGTLKGKIHFEGLNFSYLPGIPVLKGVSLDIEPGQRIGICGPTGCGKSTLASMIPRFYDPSEGAVYMDGHDVREYKVDALRHQISFVLQDTLLFYGTIRDNIAYGRPDATDPEIAEAARIAHAQEFIDKLHEGYDTLIGERGITLSAGQRQRIGITRAVIRNAPILILDEPTGSLDAGAEKEVTEALHALMKGRTVITITHRLNIIRDADRIFVMKDGEVIEDGKHNALLEEEGIYSWLYNLQVREGMMIGK